MALDAATPRVVYTGNGSASAFNVQDDEANAIYFASNSEIHASTYVVSTGVWTDLVEGVDYTLTGGPTSGVLTLSAGNLATGTKLVIWRETTLDQSDSFGASGNFSSTTHNLVAQKHRRIDQELDDAVGRALKLDRAEIGYDAADKAISKAGYLEMKEAAAPATPPTGYGRVYVQTDGDLYFKDDAGTEHNLTTYADDAAASATEAASSATDAATSATEASGSASAAAASATAAAGSATAAAGSATAAASSATAAAGSATTAAGHVTTASGHAENAAANSGAFAWELDTSTTMSDPGTGKIRFNNSTWADVTAIAIDDNSADSGNPDVSAVVLTWDDSTTEANRGTLTIRKASASGQFVVYRIAGLSTDNTGWVQLDVTHQAGNPSWSNADDLFVQFARTGNQGVPGAGSGDMLASNSLSDVSDTAAARQNIGVEIGVDVQAFDQDLTALAGLSGTGIVRRTGAAEFTTGTEVATSEIANDAVTFDKLQNISATSRILGRKTADAGNAEECTLSEILDFIGSAAQGDMLYRDASGWVRLPAGTAGQFLTTNGADANPAWADVPAGGAVGANLYLASKYR